MVIRLGASAMGSETWGLADIVTSFPLSQWPVSREVG